MTLRGAIICESLKEGTVLEGFDLRVTRWSRFEVSDATDAQPDVWTLIEFEASDDDSDALAQRLAKDLRSPGWYANWYDERQAVIVFPEKVIRYKRANRAGREAAKTYARHCGVPETQLDWDD